jgi:lipopolysaccharide transport system permease protein
MSVTTELRQSRELFVNLTQRELKGKYKRTVLGQLWSLANPLALMLVYTIVFAFFFKISPEPGDPSGLNVFPLWLLTGLLPWIFFTNVVNQGMGSLIANEGLIKKVYFPRSVLVLSTTASLIVNWAFEMAVLVVAIVIAGAWQVLFWIPGIVIAMILLGAFATGIAMMLAIANAHFRDTQYFVGIALQLGMYLTPIIYPLHLVTAQSDKLGPILGSVTLVDIYRANPMERFTAVFRSLIYDNTWPTLADSLACILAAIISLGLGLLVFRRSERTLAEIL